MAIAIGSVGCPLDVRVHVGAEAHLREWFDHDELVGRTGGQLVIDGWEVGSGTSVHPFTELP